MGGEKKPTVQEIQAERNLLDAVLENTGALVVVHDGEGRIRRFNRACEQLSGYSAKDVVENFPWQLTFPVDNAANFRAQVLVKLKNHPEAAAVSYTNSWQSKHGERHLIEWKITPLRNADGDLEYVVALGMNITAQQAMQKALRESEVQSRALFEQAAIGIAYVAPDGHWIDVNTRLCEIVGHDRSYMLGTTFQAITHPDDLDADLDYVEKLLCDEIQNYSMEKRYVRADGSHVWVNLTVSLVRDAEAKPNYFISLVQDISERKATEQLLGNSARQLREAQRITHIGSWELDLVNNKLLWSDEIYRIFEIDQSKFVASYEAFLNTIHPEDREAVDTAYTQSLKNKVPYEISHRLLMPDGRVKWVHERCENEFAADGTALHSLGTVQDITEQVRIEQELRELNHSLEKRVSERTFELASERNFISTILDTANAMVVVLDNKGCVVRINRACETLTGYHQKELQGQVPWDMLVAEEQRGIIRQTFNKILRGEATSNYELEWICKSGTRRLIAWSNSAIKNSQGEVEYVIETGVDVTERKAAEQALVQARDKAEQASRAKSDFLSRMSHELRTPLNAILGFSQLLDSDATVPLSQLQHESVYEIMQAGNHLLGLIDEILDMSRIESGRMDLTREPVAVEMRLLECMALLQNKAEQAQINVHLEPVPPEAQWVLADAERLKQILLNLLSNAIKYNQADGLVRIHCRLVKPGQVRICVTDSGAGISAEQQAMLFEPFERLDADSKAIAGTGIGLALSKRLIELMGGSIGVESEVGKGSTFWVQLASST